MVQHATYIGVMWKLEPPVHFIENGLEVGDILCLLVNEMNCILICLC